MTFATIFSDKQCLEALTLSQEAAFDALFARHYAELPCYARTLLPYPTDAVVADMFSSCIATVA